MQTLASFREQMLAGAREEAVQGLQAWADGRIDQHGEHLETARLALTLGLPSLAQRELNLVLRDHPDDSEALRELAQLAEDRGEVGKELSFRQRLEMARPEQVDNQRRLAALRAGSLEAAPPIESVAPQAAVQDPYLAATTEDLIRFLHLFAGREDVHARQWADGDQGGYSPVKRPLTPDLLRAHLAGDHTLGVYPLRLDQTVLFFALDLDINKRAIDRARGDLEASKKLRLAVHHEGLRIQARCTELGLPGVLEDSGYKGRHYWIFLREPTEAELVVRLAQALVQHLRPADPNLHIEFFPKQCRASKGAALGNLIKLPLGFHRRSMRRALLLDAQGRRVADPWEYLRRVPRLSREPLLDAFGRLREGAPPVEVVPEAAPGPVAIGLPQPDLFTEADFESRGELRHLLGHCAVLGRLVHQALHERRLSYDESVVLRHSLGHLPVGPLAVNYLFGRCPEVRGDLFMKSALAGNPISCPAIRKRIGHISSAVPCHCAFYSRPDHYPTPLLHMETLPSGSTATGRPGASAPTVVVQPSATLVLGDADAQQALDANVDAGGATRDAAVPEAGAAEEAAEVSSVTLAQPAAVPAAVADGLQRLGATLANLLERQARLEAEIVGVRQALLQTLDGAGVTEVDLGVGKWVVEIDEGEPMLVWRARD